MLNGTHLTGGKRSVQWCNASRLMTHNYLRAIQFISLFTVTFFVDTFRCFPEFVKTNLIVNILFSQMLISKLFYYKSGNSNDKDTACQLCHALRSEQVFIFSRDATAPSGPGPSHNQGFTITLRHTSFGSTLLDERSARRRGLNLTTHNAYNRQTPMSSAGFKTTTPASERPQTHTLARAATGIGVLSQFHCCSAKCSMFDDSVRWVGTVTLGRWSRYVPSKRRKPHTQRRSVTCQKNGITPLLQPQNLACRTYALRLYATFSLKLAVYFDIHLAAAMRCFCPLWYYL